MKKRRCFMVLIALFVVLSGVRASDSNVYEYGEFWQKSLSMESCFLKQPSDTTARRLLVFGDSTCDGVSRRFADYAKANGYTMYSAVWYGATFKSWAYTTELPRIMKEFQPTFVVISLGTNDLGYHDISARAEAVREIMRELGDVPFIWIGPISLKAIKKDPGIVDMLRETVGADRFYNSYDLQLARFPDGIHPTFEASAVWIDGVVDWMNNGSSVSDLVKLEKPKTTSRQFRHNEKHATKYRGTYKPGVAGTKKAGR